ncbi:hypothetical protein ACHAWF_011711 [Thalassiosira exigua]
MAFFVSKAFAILTTPLLYRGVEAWSTDNHEIAAQIANVTISDPAVREHIEYELAILDPARTLSEAASWADRIRKDRNVRLFDTFHFVNGEQTSWGGGVYECSLDRQASALSAATTMIFSIGREETPYWYRALSLRYLAHIIVDIHQPFHALSRCLDDGRGNDMGGNKGNKYAVAEGEEKLWSMHSIWDGNPWLDPELDVEAKAKTIMEKYPAATSGFTTGYYDNVTVDVTGFNDAIKAVDFSADRKEVEDEIELLVEMIIKESQLLGMEVNNFAYPDESSGVAPWPLPDEVLPPDYRDYLRKVSDARLAAGGYRLAAVLEATMAGDQFNDAPKWTISSDLFNDAPKCTGFRNFPLQAGKIYVLVAVAFTLSAVCL